MNQDLSREVATRSHDNAESGQFLAEEWAPRGWREPLSAWFCRLFGSVSDTSTVSIFGASAAQSITSRVQGERNSAREAERKKAASEGKGTSRAADEVDLTVENTVTSGAVRSLKGNADEETHDDREQQDHYLPQHAEAEKARPRLDVQG